jgi:hypothetical protein
MIRVKFYITQNVFRPDKLKYISRGSNIKILPTYPKVSIELDINYNSFIQLENDLRKMSPGDNINVEIINGHEIIEQNKQKINMYKNSIYMQKMTGLRRTKFTDPICGFTYFEDPIRGLVQVFNPVIVNKEQKYINNTINNKNESDKKQIGENESDKKQIGENENDKKQIGENESDKK